MNNKLWKKVGLMFLRFITFIMIFLIFIYNVPAIVAILLFAASFVAIMITFIILFVMGDEKNV